MTSSGYASGSPLAKFNNSATVVSPTDLTGDATTSGGSAATVVQARGGKVAWDTNGNQTKLGNNTLVGLGVPGLVYDTVVASTNTDVGNTTMVASVPTGGAIYRFTLDVQQVDAGTGCTGTWLLAPQISYTDGYSSTVFSSSGWSGHTLNGNLWGASYTLSTSTLTANNVGNWTWMFSAAQATSISFNVVMTAGTGCSKGSTAMHYVIVPILEQLNNPGT
jgi:hypothetical protein